MSLQLSLLSDEFEEPQRKVLTVTEVTRRLKQTIESRFSSVEIEGEISNFKFHSSGHMYFSLKDSSATISAVIWRSNVESLLLSPENGMKVVVRGRITVYEARGNYQIDVSAMRPLGAGEMQAAFEKLKRKLAAEGFFDPEHKKPLPRYPEQIGIVTSETGAALHDVLHVLRRRYPCIILIVRPVRVQGPGAAREIAEAIDDFNSYGKIDVLIVGRGGGSMEDLWAFNEEIVARSIFKSKIPIVSAVGHEIDFTIADFVADVRAPTPSVAAELVVCDRFALLENVRNNWYTIHENVQNVVNDHKERIQNLLNSRAFHAPVDVLRQYSQRVDELEHTMITAMNHKLSTLNAHSQFLRRQIIALNPALVLRRGYTIIRKDGRVMTSRSMVKSEDKIEITFHDGKVASEVR